MKEYVSSSLGLHLFFARIMKEHAFFLEIGFTKADPQCTNEAKMFKEAFGDLLYEVIECSRGNVEEDVLKSGEILTEYTCKSEEKTEQLSGAAIDQEITRLEKELVENYGQNQRSVGQSMIMKVKSINRRALRLLERFIEFKKWVLSQVLNCNMYTINYPLLLEHIIHEAELYEKYVQELEYNSRKEPESMKEVEEFWNHIMMEHALFIRGLLDPKEVDLIHTADQFAQEYQMLLDEAEKMDPNTRNAITDDTITETMKYRDFKLAGTQGINECKIRSLIVPLLADHVLREANHYLRLLTKG